MNRGLTDGQLASRGLSLFRQVESQDAVFKRDLDVLGVDVVGQAEAAFEGGLLVFAAHDLIGALYKRRENN